MRAEELEEGSGGGCGCGAYVSLTCLPVSYVFSFLCSQLEY